MKNPEIERLENKLYDLEREETSIYEEIEKIRKQCDHVLTDEPGIVNPWWCKKCGGQMLEATADQTGET